jgi:hypothetical protein
MIDDDLSFVGTQDGALELSYNGAQGLRLEADTNVIGGHSGNDVWGGISFGTIAGGGSTSGAHLVTDFYGTIGGGFDNLVGNEFGSPTDAQAATVGGGYGNTASGAFATVPGGTLNTASSAYSLAAGRRAKANDLGAFLWADSQDVDAFSPGQNTFSVRAAGGIWLGTAAPPATITANRFLETSTGAYLTTGGTWTNGSDANLKEGFATIDARQVLRRLSRIPIRSWSYKAEPGVRHFGPTAQHFYRAFRLGQDNRHIATVDADGVALAAIQALERENRVLKERVAALERANARIAELERAVSRLASRMR